MVWRGIPGHRLGYEGTYRNTRAQLGTARWLVDKKAALTPISPHGLGQYIHQPVLYGVGRMELLVRDEVLC